MVEDERLADPGGSGDIRGPGIGQTALADDVTGGAEESIEAYLW
jgi:hypothetical protein